MIVQVGISRLFSCQVYLEQGGKENAEAAWCSRLKTTALSGAGKDRTLQLPEIGD